MCGSAEDLGNPIDGLLHILAAVEGADPNVTLTTLTESCAWSGDDASFFEEQIEEFPRVDVGLNPDIR